MCVGVCAVAGGASKATMHRGPSPCMRFYVLNSRPRYRAASVSRCALNLATAALGTGATPVCLGVCCACMRFYVLNSRPRYRAASVSRSALNLARAALGTGATPACLGVCCACMRFYVLNSRPRYRAASVSRSALNLARAALGTGATPVCLGVCCACMRFYVLNSRPRYRAASVSRCALNLARAALGTTLLLCLTCCLTGICCVFLPCLMSTCALVLGVAFPRIGARPSGAGTRQRCRACMQLWPPKWSAAVARLDCPRPQGLTRIVAESMCASDRLAYVCGCVCCCRWGSKSYNG